MAKKSTFECFVRVFLYGALGAFCGILLGFVFGALIYGLAYMVAAEVSEVVPLSATTFMGMGFGAIIGGLFGAAIGKKN